MLMMTKRSDYGPIMAEALGWVANPWLAWGLLPFLGANAGFWLCALPLELIVSRVLAAPDGPGGPLSWRFWFRPIEWSKVSRKASCSGPGGISSKRARKRTRRRKATRGARGAVNTLAPHGSLPGSPGAWGARGSRD